MPSCRTFPLFVKITSIISALNVKIFWDGPVDELAEQDLPAIVLVDSSELWKSFSLIKLYPLMSYQI